MGLPPQMRLKRHADFVRVAQQAKGRANGLVVVRSTPNSLARSRFGFAVSKRVGGAVIRNRVKRRLQETARQLSVRPGFDVVLIARPAAADASFAGLAVAVRDAFSRAGMLTPSGDAPVGVEEARSTEALR